MADKFPYTDDEILTMASQRFSEFFDATRFWREQELFDGYSVYEGRQWLQQDRVQYENDGLPIITINKTAPVIDSISGFEIQNRTEPDYIPRMLTAEDSKYADIIDNGVKWIESTSQAPFHNSMAFLDSLICGIGSTDTLIDYNKNDRGEVAEERIFPGFLLFDPAARKKNMKDASWLGKAKIVDRRTNDEELAADDKGYADKGAFTFDDQMFLQYYNILNTRLNITVNYDFQWRKLIKVVRVQNPFMSQEAMGSPLIMNYAAEAEKIYGIRGDDSTLVFEPDMYSKFKKSCESLGLAMGKVINQKKYKYYRAVIKGGIVTEKAENYSQTDFSIQVITGKYSETDQCYYGIMRAAKAPQRLYNMAMADWQGFINTTPKGGVVVEKGAVGADVSSIKKFIQTWVKAKHVTVVQDGAVSGGKIMLKPTASMPPGLEQMIPSMDSSIMQVAGVSPQFMGMIETKEMTSSLHGRLVRQTLSMLAQYFDAKKFFTISKGYLYIDCLRLLVENEPGRMVRNVLGKGSEKYIAMFSDDIASEYDIEVEDAPETPDEKRDRFDKLLELAGLLLNRPNPVDIMPLTMQYAPLKQDDIEAINEAMKPPPPPPPNPLEDGMLQSTINMQNATAEEKTANAMRIRTEVLNEQRKMDKDMQGLDADLRKTDSETSLNQAKIVDLLNKEQKE